jgi:hypothetical protein
MLGIVGPLSAVLSIYAQSARSQRDPHKMIFDI